MVSIEILATVFFLGVLHGLIPSHWVPVMALKKQYHWTVLRTFKITALVSIAHIMSTIIIGVAFSFLGNLLSRMLQHTFSIQVVSSLILFLFGIIFIYRHYYHHHFHLYHQDEVLKQKNTSRQIRLLIIAMLFSPCMEITGMYFVGGIFNWQFVVWISLIYFIVSFFSSLLWILFFDALSKKFNFHHIEHNSGLLSGMSLIISAVLIYFI